MDSEVSNTSSVDTKTSSTISANFKKTMNEISATTSDLINTNHLQNGLQHTLKNISEAFTPSLTTLPDEQLSGHVQDQAHVSDLATKKSAEAYNPLRAPVDSSQDESSEPASSTPPLPCKKKRKKKRPVKIIGLKTTKRAINDGYTIVVRRHFMEDRSHIIFDVLGGGPVQEHWKW